jgi:hypothetical protein
MVLYKCMIISSSLRLTRIPQFKRNFTRKVIFICPMVEFGTALVRGRCECNLKATKMEMLVFCEAFTLPFPALPFLLNFFLLEQTPASQSTSYVPDKFNLQRLVLSFENFRQLCCSVVSHYKNTRQGGTNQMLSISLQFPFSTPLHWSPGISIVPWVFKEETKPNHSS